jgi:hypothetical protein
MLTAIQPHKDGRPITTRRFKKAPDVITLWYFFTLSTSAYIATIIGPQTGPTQTFASSITMAP